MASASRLCWWRWPRPGRSCSKRAPADVARISQGQGTESCPHSKWVEIIGFQLSKKGKMCKCQSMSKKLFARISPPDPWHKRWLGRRTWTGEHDGEGSDQVPGYCPSEITQNYLHHHLCIKVGSGQARELLLSSSRFESWSSYLSSWPSSLQSAVFAPLRLDPVGQENAREQPRWEQGEDTLTWSSLSIQVRWS